MVVRIYIDNSTEIKAKYKNNGSASKFQYKNYSKTFYVISTNAVFFAEKIFLQEIFRNSNDILIYKYFFECIFVSHFPNASEVVRIINVLENKIRIHNLKYKKREYMNGLSIKILKIRLRTKILFKNYLAFYKCSLPAYILNKISVLLIFIP